MMSAKSGDRQENKFWFRCSAGFLPHQQLFHGWSMVCKDVHENWSKHWFPPQDELC